MLFVVFFVRVRRGDLSGSSLGRRVASSAPGGGRRPLAVGRGSRASVVKHHAEHVWGPAWEMEDRPAPKVFSLVGKSASEVRELSGLVCQEGTGTEERVALNRVMRAPLEV